MKTRFYNFCSKISLVSISVILFDGNIFLTCRLKNAEFSITAAYFPSQLGSEGIRKHQKRSQKLLFGYFKNKTAIFTIS